VGWTGYRFVTEADYIRCAHTLLAQATVPIIAPLSQARQLRWKRVLDWYRLADAKPNIEVRETVRTPRCVKATVIALSEAAAAPARVFAQATNAPLLCWSKESRRLPAGSLSGEPALVVGSPKEFTHDRIAALQASLSGPWGVATALDLPGLSLVIAKLLADRPEAAQTWGMVDVDSGVMSELADDGALVSQAITQATLVEWLTKRDWSGLAILAHGDGAHANLESAVLCGLPVDAERGPWGDDIDGCRADDTGRRCKRVHNRATRIIGFGDIRTEALCLLSCNGFAVAGQLYPSNVSAVLAAAEGYPRQILTTDRPFTMDSEAVRTVAVFGRATGSLAVSQLLENDVCQYRTGARPFVLCGVPDLSADLQRIARPDGSFRIDAGDLTATSLNSASTFEVLSVLSEEKRSLCRRGLRTITMVWPAGRRPACDIVDYTPQWRSCFEALRALASRTRRAAQLERTVPRYYAPALASDTEFQTRLRDLARARSNTDNCAQAGLDIAEHVRRRGTWDAELEKLTQMASVQASLWDSGFATLLLSQLFKGPVESLPLSGLTLIGRTQGAPCSRCGLLLTMSRYGSGMNGVPSQEYAECSICGFNAVRASDGPRLLCITPDRLSAGDAVHLDVTVENASLGNAPWWLVGELKDKGRGVVVARWHQRCTGASARITLNVRSDLTADLHTIYLGWVHGMDIALLRIRCPGVTSKSLLKNPR
jgi:hypothetical protein